MTAYESTKTRAAARRTRPPITDTELETERSTLLAIVHAIAEAMPDEHGSLSFEQLHKINHRFPKKAGGFFAKSHILAGYRLLASTQELPIAEAELIARLSFRPTRTQSGVTPVTVLTKPYPCPGKCIFCPNDVRMPKSLSVR